jgi:16S rRNA (guanine527-N7)-methyltransferase
VAVLEEARGHGFLGPGPVAAHLEHASGFAEALGQGAGPAAAVDLGSGGGVPGLVLATAWPGSAWTLVEAHGRHAAFLDEAVARLGCSDRVRVVHERAEVVGRDPAHRGAYLLVVARSFGPPGVTAECAAPLLAPGGVLVVSEPPASAGARWHPDGLARLGAAPERVARTPKGTFQVIRQASPCPDRYPRRVGVPAKRPLF